MPDWLAEGDTTITVVLVVVAVCFGISAWKSKRKAFFAVAGIALAAVVAMIVIDRMYESDREQIERKVHEFAGELKEPFDTKKAFSYVSEEFNYHGTKKEAFRRYCEDRL